MKRFIRYLYEYEQDKRLRNVGFVKAEQGDRECVLHIHGKGLNLQEEKSLRVYLFFTEEGACFGIWQGDAQNVNPAINYRLYYTDQDVGGKEQFARIGGVILEAAGGRKFAAVWDDEAVNIGGMRVYTEERREQEIPAGEEADEQEISRRSPPEKKRMRRSRMWKRRIRIARVDSFVPRSRERIWPDCPDASGSCPTTVSCFTAIIITITWYFWTTGNGSEWECRGSTIQRSRRRRKPSGFRNSSGEETLWWSWKKKSGKKTTDSDTGAGASGGRGRESSVSMREKIPWKNRKKMKNI